MKSTMSNFEFKLVADTLPHFMLGMEIAFLDGQEAFSPKKDYDVARSYKIEDGEFVLSRLGHGTPSGVPEGFMPLPMAMTWKQAAELAAGWFQSEEAKAVRAPRPSIDGSSSEGAFVLTVNRVSWHEIVRIKPTWSEHHK